MVNILIIHSSPHKGRTYQATMDFLKALESRLEATVHHVFLFQEHLEFCRGCGVCVLHGESKCPIKDGFRGIHAQMEDADVVIITTPVYALHLTGLLKNFIDRSAYIMHRPRYFGKWCMTLSTQAISGEKDVAKYIKNVMHFRGFNVIPGLHLTMSQDEKIIQKKINAAADVFQSIVQRPRFTPPIVKRSHDVQDSAKRDKTPRILERVPAGHRIFSRARLAANPLLLRENGGVVFRRAREEHDPERQAGRTTCGIHPAFNCNKN